MERKTALITGITGQDGSYLAELLLEKGYDVHGIKRRSSSFNEQRINHLHKVDDDCSANIIDNIEHNNNFYVHYGDMTDTTSILRLIQEVQPDEVYNLAAQSHVKISFDCPEYTATTDALGTLKILEAIRILKMQEKTKFYQASTSELYGLVNETPQTEKTTFYPRSPYGCAKLYAYWITVNYREAYNMFAANGILFNHESPRRGTNFVSKKITMAVARIKLGLQKNVALGNLSAKRDWGHAKDYVHAMWLMMQQNEPDDFIIATGSTTSVREFCKLAFQEVGIDIEFVGEGIYEKGINATTGEELIVIDAKYFRPTEVELLCGDASKAKRKLGWIPTYNLHSLVKEMIEYDIREAQRDLLLYQNGYKNHLELLFD